MTDIVQKTIDSIEKGKKQIFEIAEETRQECKELDDRLGELKEKVKTIISDVECLEIQEKENRRKLMKVSKNFNNYSEEDIRKAYESTKNLQIQLILKREQEQQLIAQRTDMEKQLKRVRSTLERAEYLIGHVASAMNYLTIALMNMSGAIEEVNKKEEMGVRIIMAQEEERQRVARDIHDGPAQSLSNLALKCEICEKLIDVDIEQARGEIRGLKQLVRGCLREIRKIIFDLRPMSLDDLGLIPTLQQYTEQFMEETEIDIILDTYSKDISIDSIIEVAIFRIVQEALNNIEKYANAKQVYISLRIREDMLLGAIIDNGVGFDNDKKQVKYNKEAGSGGFGIYGMRQRAELLKGKLKVHSQPGKGTTVRLEIPLSPMERK